MRRRSQRRCAARRREAVGRGKAIRHDLLDYVEGCWPGCGRVCVAWWDERAVP